MRNRIAKLIEAEARDDPSVVFLTGDLGYSVVEPLAEALGERFINMGVAEANMIGVASSLAASGFKPFVYSITPFVTARCFEQIRNDVAYQKRAVRIVGVGAGFSYGSLGPSHHGLDDAHLMAALPGMIIGNPWNLAELDQFYAMVAKTDCPAYFRIARETGAATEVRVSLDARPYVVRDGADLTLVGSGSGVTQCLDAAAILERDGVTARVVSVPVLAPFPKVGLARLIEDSPVVGVFEGYPGNPLSHGIMEALLDGALPNRFVDIHVRHEASAVVGDTNSLRRQTGLDPASIAARCVRLMQRG